MNIAVAKPLQFIKRFFAFAGPAYLVAVGYMDPGNWATDLAGGAQYGYILLSVILISNCIAIALQYCALKLGIVTGKDLARACRDYYPRPVAYLLWILAELAVIATDLAEVIGSAIGLQLLFGIPLIVGICLTAADVLLLLLLMHHHTKVVEILVTVLIATIIGCFTLILYWANPSLTAILQAMVPSKKILFDPQLLYLAIGIVGATVMPHNLYLHSALVKKDQDDSLFSKKEAIFYSFIDTAIALTVAFFVNAAILIVAAAIFHQNSLFAVVEIQDAYRLLTPILSSSVASALFAIALLISGQNSTLTGTLAGQIILEGFLQINIPAWLRRLIGRLITIIPALAALIFFGESSLSWLMILSQIILSLQLPFAVFPLVQFTSCSTIMGSFANCKFFKITTYLLTTFIIMVNVLLLYFLILNATN